MRLPSYSKVAMVVMVRVLECMVSAGSAAVTDMWGECATPLTPLFSCLSFMQSNGAGGRPSAECCNAMAQVQITSAKCFCVIAKDGASAFMDFPFTYNTTLELLLPSLCHLRTNASKCIELLKLSPNSSDAQRLKEIANFTDNLLFSDPAMPVHIECGGFWRRHKNTILIAGSASSTTLVIIVIFGSLLRKKYTVSKETPSTNIRGILSASNGVISTKLFIGKDIKNVTSSFSTSLLLGSGGFGDIYKGCLEDGTIVAVKVAKKDSTKSTEQVLNELKILSQVNHKCVVRLLGCCIELEQPMLVYEFVPNGTLYEHIHTDRFGFLNWQQRLKIAHQAAYGLAYLHSFAVPPIYHRDVKSSNVLLDSNCNAKISDFGLSRLIDENRTHVSTCL